eukprot:2184053-Prymnesium_polylepis.1
MGGFGRFRAFRGDFPLKTAQNRAGNPTKRCVSAGAQLSYWLLPDDNCMGAHFLSSGIHSS